MTRVLASTAAALVFSLLLLFALRAAISPSREGLRPDAELRVVDFVRLKRDSELQQKQRPKPRRPEPRKPPPRPRVDLPKPQLAKPPAAPQARFRPSPALDLSATSALSDAVVDSAAEQPVSADILPLVRVEPVYPRRAKRRKKEGRVVLSFTITPVGSVSNVRVTEANPPDLFERAARRALLKWKFKPKIVDGEAVSQQHSVAIDFRLD